MASIELPDIDLVIEIAQRAGKKVFDIYQEDEFNLAIKPNNSPVTTADLAAHKIIFEGLKGLTKSIPVLSEESELIPWSERKKWKKYWLIDPLDGTKEFINKNGEFTINIALIFKNIPILIKNYIL